MSPEKGWDPRNYPAEYVETFYSPDEEAIHRVLLYAIAYCQSKRVVDAVVLEETFEGTVVHILMGCTLRAINWEAPQILPADLDGCGDTAYLSAGPHQRQVDRAHLLADTVQAVNGVITMKQLLRENKVISFPSIGIKITLPKKIKTLR